MNPRESLKIRVSRTHGWLQSGARAAACLLLALGPSGGNLRAAIQDFLAESPYANESFSKVQTDLGGDIWAQSGHTEILRLSGRTWRSFGRHEGLSGYIEDLKIMSDGTPWVASGGQLYYFDGETFSPVALPDSIRQNHLSRIQETHDGQIALFGFKDQRIPFMAALDAGVWSTQELPDEIRQASYYSVRKGVQVLAAVNGVYTRKQDEPWRALLGFESQVVHFFETREHGLLTVASAENNGIRVWKIDLEEGTSEPLVNDWEAAPGNEFALAENAAGQGVVSLGDRVLRSFVIRGQNVYSEILSTPEFHRPIRSLAIADDGTVLVAGDELLTKITSKESQFEKYLSDGIVLTRASADLFWVQRSGKVDLVDVDDPELSAIRSLPGDVLGLSDDVFWLLDPAGILYRVFGEETVRIEGLPELSGTMPISIISGTLSSFVFQARNKPGVVFEINDDDAFRYTIPVPEISSLLSIARCSEKYIWILAEHQNAETFIHRWDPILDELLSQKLPAEDPPNGNEHIYTQSPGGILLYSGNRLIEIDRNMERLPRHLLEGAKRIFTPYESVRAKLLLVPYQRKNGEHRVFEANSTKREDHRVDLSLWSLTGVTDESMLMLRRKDRRAIGRLQLGEDSAVSQIELPDMETMNGSILKMDNRLLFACQNSQRVIAYKPELSVPEATIAVSKQFNANGEDEWILTLTPPAQNEFHAIHESLQASFRIDGGEWFPFQNVDKRGQIRLPRLEYGAHEVEVRVRSRDFVESSHIAHFRVIAEEDRFAKRPEDFIALYVSCIVLLIISLILAKLFSKQSSRTRLLEKEVHARQQAQLDLVDINQDLEKRLTRRSQEIAFANEGLKKSVDAQKHTEAKLKHAQSALIEASQYSGVAETATGILQNIGTMLNSLYLSLNTVEKRIHANTTPSGLVKLLELVEKNKNNPDFLVSDSRGKKVPEYLKKLSSNAKEEQKINRHYIEDIATTIDHLKDIVNAQQDYARVGALVERVEVSELIRQTLKLSEHSIGRDDLVIETEVQDCPSIQIERPRLQHVLLNLLQNAQWACSENNESIGRILIRAFALDEENVAIEVKDNGLGIEKADLAKVFYHGFSTREKGSGLGLNAVETMVKQMRGKVEVFSDGYHTGALFRIVLPIQAKTTKDGRLSWPQQNTPPIRGSR